MKLKDVLTKAGPVADYFVYIILLFGWNIVNDVVSTNQPGLFGPVIDQVLLWVLRLLVSPFVLVVVLGGIHERQEIQDVFERNSFLSPIKTHILRLLGANLLYALLYLFVSIIAILIGESVSPDFAGNEILLGIISAFLSMISLFWFSAIVVERKMFSSLARSIKTLLRNPVALAIGILWAVFCFADTFLFDIKSEQVSLAINIARSGVFAVLKVLAVMYILVVYKNMWGIRTEMAGEKTLVGTSPTRPGEELARTSLGFTFFSFVPLVHLVALILGVIALKRSHRFILKAAIACWMGGFFTILYSLFIAGMLIGQSNNFHMPGYAFLADGNAELETYVALLNEGAVDEVEAQLGNTSSNNSDRNWAFDCALAIAKYESDNLNGALSDFYTALQKNPERSEFYLYYGVALLENDKEEMAMEQFQLALEHEPKMEVAEKYISLLQNSYRPTTIESALMYIVILLILFTLHEYGHAFSAWKLGDDTAKNLGRVTLNPIAHLDIFGSILLPAILLLQQSGAIFGWAKPVPVNPKNFKNPNKDDMLVSFAGPAVNLMVAMVCMIILGLIVLCIRVLWPDAVSLNLAAPYAAAAMVGAPFSKAILILIVFLKQMLYTSLILGFLNLIPVPPLDGSWIVAGLLPQGLRGIFERARQFGFMFFILLTMTPLLDYFLSIPVSFAWTGLHLLVSVMGFV